MPTRDQLQVFIQYVFIASCIAMFAIGVALVVVWIIGKTGPSRRVSRHRKGARFHKPTYIPVNVQPPHPYEPIAYLQAHVRRTTSVEILSATKIMPKINVEVNHAAVRQ
jgi:hypothetical protein